MGKKTKKIKKGVVKELFDLEIDEVSAVDKPAIGEEFYITKSVKTKNKGQAMGKKVKKSVAWKSGVKKAKSEDTHCVFCGITKEDEESELGMGLIKGVCFGCACEHSEEGVFDECVEGTFDVDAFAKKYPEIELRITKNEDEEEDGDEEENEEGDESEDNDEDEDSDEEDNDDEDDDEESEGEEDESQKNTASGSGDDEEDSESNDDDVAKRLSSVEKSMEDVEAMLSRSLELHDMAAGALNEVVTLTFASLDMLMQSMDEETKSIESFTTLHDAVKSVRSDIKKAATKKRGAKISAKRMRVLRQIAEQLSELLTSVQEAEKGGQTKKSLTESEEFKKSLEKITSEVTEALKEFKEDIVEQLDEVQEKMDELEQSGDGSNSIDDEDEEDDDEGEEEETEKGDSIFSNILKINDIKKDISGREERKKAKNN